MKQIKSLLKAALPAGSKIDNIWNIQGAFYGYQLKGVSYPCRFKIVDNEAILLN